MAALRFSPCKETCHSQKRRNMGCGAILAEKIRAKERKRRYNGKQQSFAAPEGAVRGDTVCESR